MQEWERREEIIFWVHEKGQVEEGRRNIPGAGVESSGGGQNLYFGCVSGGKWRRKNEYFSYISGISGEGKKEYFGHMSESKWKREEGIFRAHESKWRREVGIFRANEWNKYGWEEGIFRADE